MFNVGVCMGCHMFNVGVCMGCHMFNVGVCMYGMSHVQYVYMLIICSMYSQLPNYIHLHVRVALPCLFV